MLLLFIMVCLHLELHSQSLYNVAKDTALSYNGIREVSYNYSPIIKRFNGNSKRSWCMDFVYYCYDASSKVLKIKNKLSKTSSCSQQLKYANCIGSGMNVIKFTSFGKITIKYGIGIFKHKYRSLNDIGKMWTGHAGIFLKVINSNTFQFIEGNTNNKGTREGGFNSNDGIFIKNRDINNPNLPLIAIIEV